MDEVRLLAQRGKPDEAVARVEAEASGGNAEAMYVLANWRFWGLYGPRDTDETHRLLERAQPASLDAALMRAALLNNGTGCNADPAQARAILSEIAPSDPRAAIQLRLLDLLDRDASFPTTEILASDPDIRLYRRFLPDDVSRYLQERATPLLGPSTIIDDRTGRPVPHPVRTSSSMNFDPIEEDLVVHAVNRRIADTTGTDVEAGEPLHILRYTPGQEFRPHLDAIPGAQNQRQWTALVYLNDDYTGGETVFPEIGLTVAAGKGNCLVFRNSLDDGSPNPKGRHAGLPVAGGVKWLASRWIRQRPYTAEIIRG